MENILIDMRNQGTTLTNYFKDKNLVDVDTLLTKFEEVLDELEEVKGKFEDFKQEVEDNYKPISMCEHLGIDNTDFYEDR